MQFNILRTKKIKDRLKITQAVEHNLRLRHQHNIKSARTKDNKILLNTLDADPTDASDFQTKLSEHYKSLDITEKSSNVLIMEFFASASPSFFKGKTYAEIHEWADHQVEFFKEKFGLQLKMAVLHMDESSPHLHFFISTEHKTVGADSKLSHRAD